MAEVNIAHQRLHNQHLSGDPFQKPEDVVQALGAVQAQDYGAAKWALGLRLQDASDSAVEQAFTDGAILRTHILRPTWHFVTPADIRWMLKLTAPRVNAATAYYYRKLQLDETVFSQSSRVLEKTLQGGKQLTRTELASALQQAGIATDDLRLTHLMLRAELDGIICSGARRGKQFTYALLEERVPQAKPLERDEALAELTRRYFVSRGPATVQDFVWWSGLTAADARAGLDMIQSILMQETINGQTYWLDPSHSFTRSADAYLLPNFDEYAVSYTDRSAITGRVHPERWDARINNPLGYTVVIDGQIVASWKRIIKKDAVIVSANPLTTFTAADQEAFANAARRYAAFLGLPLLVD